jgi:hypothetical protein
VSAQPDSVAEVAGRRLGPWVAEIHLEDGEGRQTWVGTFEAPDEHRVSMWARATLESLRWNGRPLAQDESFCYVASVRELRLVATGYLFSQHEPVDWARIDSEQAL